MNLSDTQTFEEIELQWEQYAVVNRIREDIPNAQLDCYRYANIDALFAKLSAYVLKEEFEPVTETLTQSIPATWWQHFKRDHFPNWLVRRFPVRTIALTATLTCVPKAIYPRAKIKFGEPTYKFHVLVKDFAANKFSESRGSDD